MKVLIYSLISIVFLSSTDMVFSLVSFKTFQNKIAKTICENKDKPQLKCNGKCAFSKAIKKKQQEKQNNSDLKTGEKQSLYFHSIDFIGLLRSSIKRNKINAALSFCFLSLPIHIFHPPD